MPTEAAEALHEILTERKLTISCAESLTVGRVATHLGECSGSSSYFAGGVVAYNIDQKVKLLGVDRQEAEACDCVSKGIAYWMAKGVMMLFDTDIGIATTGYAEPCPDQGFPHAGAWVAIGVRNPDNPDEADIHHFYVHVIQEVRGEDSRVNAQEGVAYKAVEFCVNVLAPGTIEMEEE